MIGTLLSNIRRRLLVLFVALFLVFSAFYAPVILDSTAGTTLVAAVFACGPPGGGC